MREEHPPSHGTPQAGQVEEIRPARRRVAFVGNIGNGNLGDEASVASMMRYLRERWPGVEFLVYTLDETDSRARYGTATRPAAPWMRSPEADSAPAVDRPQAAGATAQVPRSRLRAMVRAYPGLGALARAIRHHVGYLAAALKEARFTLQNAFYLRRVDLVLFAGGGQITDIFGGPGTFPYLVMRWTFLAKLLRRRVALVSVGATTLRSPLSRQLLRYALRRADYCSVRDERSRAVVREQRLLRDVPVFPDLVFGLPCPDIRNEPGGSAGGVAINVYPHRDPRYDQNADASAYRHYVELLADLVHRVLTQGRDVVLFPTQIRADPLVIDDVLAQCRRRQDDGIMARVRALRPWSVEDLLRSLASVEAVIATRFHAIVFSMLLHKPVIALANQDKMRDLMTAFELQHYLIDLASADAETVSQRLDDLLANAAGIGQTLARQLAAYRAQLSQQDAHIFGSTLLAD